MKRVLFGIGILLIFAACAIQKKVVKENKAVIIESPADSTEYELETFDPQFETWYELHNTPSTYHSQSYYESWNKQYVSAWNFNATNSRKAAFFEPIVGYDPTVDYGFELNHKLFYYFQYVERVLKIRIIQGGPRVVLY
ncbi:MAG: hypothetical protein J7L95_07285 [Prolixibacteraceae bacterium]|nr:hypothetical protein [Prolixibacteraceae bacterium]